MSDAVSAGAAPRPLRPPARAGMKPLRRRIDVLPPAMVRFTLYLFVISIPFEALPISEVLAGRFSLARAAGLLLFFAALFHPRTALRRPHAAVWWFGLWIALVAARIPFQDPLIASMSWEYVRQIVQMIALLWIASNVLRSTPVWRRTLVLFACACAGLALVQAAGGVAIRTGLGERVTTMGENPNTIGTLLAIALVVAIGLARTLVRGWLRIALLAVCVPMAIELVRTGSRAAMLALVTGLLVMTVRSRGFGGKMKAALVAIPLLAGFLLVVSSSETARNRIQQTFEEGRFARREQIVPLVVDMIREKPLIGWGPEQHVRELGTRMDVERMDEHNLFLWVLNEGGLLAFVPFMIAALLAVREADRGRHVGRGTLMLGLVAALFLANMANSYHNRKFSWLILALSISTPRMRRVSAPSGAAARPLAGTPGPEAAR